MPIPALLRYLSDSELSALDQARVLGVIRYADAGRPSGDSLCVEAPPLAATPLHEVWISASPVRRGTTSEIQWAENDQVLFGFTSRPFEEGGIDDVASAAYQAIGALLQKHDRHGLLRVWHHVPKINAIVKGLEEYQRFCRGRHDGLSKLGYELAADLPAASAVGCDGKMLTIFFLAAREGGLQLENPRQMSAYRYPAQYGPKSPSFSRATLKSWGDAHQLFISGTASIVGHASLHVDDVREQLAETLRNMQAVLDVASTNCGRALTLRDLSAVKLYVRDAADLPVIESGLRKELVENVSLLTLRADICRAELLLEIEGYAEIR